MKKQGYFLGVPYDWRWPTWKLIKERFWNKKDHRVFTPHILGWGYSINFYELAHNPRKHTATLLILIAGVGLLIAFIAVRQVHELDKAHSTFENYYTYRGCKELIERTENYGLCKTDAGKTIKIVKYQGKWYLEGDLPCGFLCF